MKRMETRLQAGETLIVDGAMGTLLQDAGLPVGACPEAWCLTQPDRVRGIHAAYRAAGSDGIECNSFGANRYKLQHYGLEDQVAAINRAAAALAREVAGSEAHVLGSIGPTGVFMEPYGDATESAVVAAFAEQAVALEAGGADVGIVETMSALEECLAAIRAVRDHTSLTLVASMTFDPRRDGGYASMMGVTPTVFARAAAAAGAHVIGSNCGVGPAAMLEIIRELRAAVPDVPIMAMPNAGLPVCVDGRTVFREAPASMGAQAAVMRDAGARLIGGCCGTTPAHIAAMVKQCRAAPAVKG